MDMPLVIIYLLLSLFNCLNKDTSEEYIIKTLIKIRRHTNGSYFGLLLRHSRTPSCAVNSIEQTERSICSTSRITYIFYSTARDSIAITGIPPPLKL